MLRTNSGHHLFAIPTKLHQYCAQLRFESRFAYLYLDKILRLAALRVEFVIRAWADL